MGKNLSAAVAFGELLKENPKAAAYYDRCTPKQREAILLQLEQMPGPAQLRAFVDNLPGASL